MTFSITKLAILALASVGQAFVVETFAGPNCEGDVLQEVNVYDNTCATWAEGFMSVRPKYYGGKHQFATIYAPFTAGRHQVSCQVGAPHQQQFYADGGDDFYQKGNCIDLGWEGRAMGSRYLV